MVRVAEVERRIAEHYRTVQLPAERIAEIHNILRQALTSRRDEAEAAEKTLTLRIQRLTNERQKLLQLHYADAIPLELFKQEQERITRGMNKARGQLADLSLEFETIEKNLTRALELARDCHAAYEAADENTRRLFNQAFFERLTVHDDGEVTHELAQPFKILLDPRLPGELAPKSRKKVETPVDVSAEGSPWWSDNETDLASGEVGGSNFSRLVNPNGQVSNRLEGSNVGLLVPPTEFESVLPA